MTNQPSTSSERILYRTDDGRMRFEWRFDDGVSVTHAERAALEVG